MATLVKYTTTESEVQILYEYLAEASVVFPKVFPIIHSLLDAKINNLLSMCHNKKILASVQAIIQNMVAISFEEEKLQQQLHYLQVKTCFQSTTCRQDPWPFKDTVEVDTWRPPELEGEFWELFFNVLSFD